MVIRCISCKWDCFYNTFDNCQPPIYFCDHKSHFIHAVVYDVGYEVHFIDCSISHLNDIVISFVLLQANTASSQPPVTSSAQPQSPPPQVSPQTAHTTPTPATPAQHHPSPTPVTAPAQPQPQPTAHPHPQPQQPQQQPPPLPTQPATPQPLTNNLDQRASLTSEYLRHATTTPTTAFRQPHELPSPFFTNSNGIFRPGFPSTYQHPAHQHPPVIQHTPMTNTLQNGTYGTYCLSVLEWAVTVNFVFFC